MWAPRLLRLGLGRFGASVAAFVYSDGGKHDALSEVGHASMLTITDTDDN